MFRTQFGNKDNDLGLDAHIDKPISIKMSNNYLASDLSKPITGTHKTENLIKGNPYLLENNKIDGSKSINHNTFSAFKSTMPTDKFMSPSRMFSGVTQKSGPDLRDTEKMMRYYTDKRKVILDTSHDDQEQDLVAKTLNLSLNSSFRGENHLEGCITVHVKWQMESFEEDMSINVHPERQVSDLIKVVVYKLNSKYIGLTFENCKIIKDSRMLINEDSLHEWKVGHDEELICQIFDKSIEPLIDESFTQEPHQQNLSNGLVNLDQVKGLNVFGYYLIPDYTEIIRMTKDEVRRIENFTIGNQHGKVVWENQTDILSIFEGVHDSYKTIENLVDIQNSALTVYKDDSNKPLRGQGLNKPAIIYLLGMYPKAIKNKLKNSQVMTEKEVVIFDKYKARLREMVRANGDVFLSYRGKQGELCFSVSGF